MIITVRVSLWKPFRIKTSTNKAENNSIILDINGGRLGDSSFFQGDYVNTPKFWRRPAETALFKILILSKYHRDHHETLRWFWRVQFHLVPIPYAIISWWEFHAKNIRYCFFYFKAWINRLFSGNYWFWF